MTQWEFSHIPFEGDLADDRIVCQKCGWNWKVKDGGNDLFICHKCGYDNQSAYSNFIDPTVIIQGVGEISKGIGSVAQARATKESSKIDVQKQLDARCGKKKKGKNKKEYNSCKAIVLSTLDAQARQDYEEKQKQLDFQRKAYTQSQKNQKITTFVVVGIFALILGFAVYKKYNK